MFCLTGDLVSEFKSYANSLHLAATLIPFLSILLYASINDSAGCIGCFYSQVTKQNSNSKVSNTN